MVCALAFEENSTCCNALAEAIRRQFIIKDGDDFIEQVLRKAWTKLSQSEDPAVRHFAFKLTYLPEGSQPQDPSAIPEIEWLTEGLLCKVNTAAGTCLGFARKQPDGAWSIMPFQGGAVRPIAPAIKLKDAANYLLHCLTRQVTVDVDGRKFETRIVWDKDVFLGTGHCEVVFWDTNHELVVGDHLSVTLQPREERPILHQVNGTITRAAAQSVTIEGVNRILLREGIED